MQRLLCALFLAIGTATAQIAPIEALKGLDPIALCAGTELPGHEHFALEHGRFRYRFANAENRATFDADRERFAIQLGGGCGSMGPLSGLGDAARWHVHAGRIYIFASDQCRDAFLANPDAHVTKPEAQPETLQLPDAAKRLLDLALKYHGGDALASARQITWREDHDVEWEGRTYTLGQAISIASPDRVRVESWSDDRHRIDVVAGADGFVHEIVAGDAGTWDHDASQRIATRRRATTHPLTLLRRHAQGQLSAGLVGAGATQAQVIVHDGESLRRVTIDQGTGAISRISYDTAKGRVTKRFSDWRDVSGVKAPFREETRVGDTSTALEWDAFEISTDADSVAFVRPGAEAQVSESVKPGINDNFTSAQLDVEGFVNRFESESREIFVHRVRLARALGLQPGDAIADIGAGTGLFEPIFAREVGDTGKVYAVDISEKFVANLKARMAKLGLDQVETVLCSDRSAHLPTNSVDAIFVCDTYHHFEYPAATLASMHRALREDGTLIVVDFDRIPGKSRPFILGHVRADKATFRSEIESAGFTFVEEIEVEGLRENYVLKFRKAPAKPNQTVLFDGKSLDGWKKTVFGGEGEVYVEDGKIIMEWGSPMTGVTWDGAELPKVDYEITLKAARVSGSDFFCGLTFPVKDSHASLILGGWGGSLCGISSIDGKDASDNETMQQIYLETGKTFAVRLVVQSDRIRVWLDGESLIDVNIEGKTIGIRPEVEPSLPLGIASFATKASIANVRIRSLSSGR